MLLLLLLLLLRLLPLLSAKQLSPWTQVTSFRSPVQRGVCSAKHSCFQANFDFRMGVPVQEYVEIVQKV